METSVLIPSNDMSRHVNEIVETIPEIVFDEFKHHLGAAHIIQKCLYMRFSSAQLCNSFIVIIFINM